jgi:hypothetical protein
LQIVKMLKIKSIGRMTLIIMKILIIKVKICKKQIENGLPKKRISNYTIPKPIHTNKQNVTSLKNIKIRFAIKPLPKIISILKVKS